MGLGLVKVKNMLNGKNVNEYGIQEKKLDE